MNTYLVIFTIRHKTIQETGKNTILARTVKAKSFGKAEQKVIKKWAEKYCVAEVIQISCYN